jgi:hypothetical protein
VIHQVEESKPDGSIKFDDEVNVAFFVRVVSSIGTKQADFTHPKLFGEITPVSVKELNDCFARQHLQEYNAGDTERVSPCYTLMISCSLLFESSSILAM